MNKYDSGWNIPEQKKKIEQEQQKRREKEQLAREATKKIEYEQQERKRDADAIRLAPTHTRRNYRAAMNFANRFANNGERKFKIDYNPEVSYKHAKTVMECLKEELNPHGYDASSYGSDSFTISGSDSYTIGGYSWEAGSSREIHRPADYTITITKKENNSPYTPKGTPNATIGNEVARENAEIARQNTWALFGLFLQFGLMVVFLYLLWGTCVIRMSLGPGHGIFILFFIFSLIMGLISLMFRRRAGGNWGFGFLIIMNLSFNITDAVAWSNFGGYGIGFFSIIATTIAVVLLVLLMAIPTIPGLIIMFKAED